MAGTIKGEVEPVTFKPAILWLDGTVMSEVGVVAFQGAGNTVVNWHGYV